MILSPNKKATHQKCPSTFSICLFIFISKGSSDSCPCSAWLVFFSKQCYNDTGLYGLLFLDHSALVFSSEGFIQNVCCHKNHTLTTSYYHVHIISIFALVGSPFRIPPTANTLNTNNYMHVLNLGKLSMQYTTNYFMWIFFKTKHLINELQGVSLQKFNYIPPCKN